MTTGGDAVLSHDVWLRRTAIVFLVALLVHGADHLDRGVDVVTTLVLTAGSIQIVLGVVAVALVFTRHPAAPRFAALVGFASAIGFTMAHLLPEWSAFSDSLVEGQVDALTWVAVIAEIAGAVLMSAAGAVAIRARGSKPRAV